MDVLIQNNGSAPLYVNIRGQGEDKSIARTIMFGEHEVTKISEEIYQTQIITSPFFKARIEDGTVVVLNQDMLGESAAKQATQLHELAYAKYVDLMKKIRSGGGLANKEFAPYLNADGTPKLELLNANFGRNIDPEVAQQFRTRYLAEAGEGMHEDTLVLPGGAKVDTGHRDIEIKKEGSEEEPIEESVSLESQITQIKSMKLAELKVTAKAMEIEFDDTITEAKLRSKIIAELRGNKD